MWHTTTLWSKIRLESGMSVDDLVSISLLNLQPLIFKDILVLLKKARIIANVNEALTAYYNDRVKRIHIQNYIAENLAEGKYCR